MLDSYWIPIAQSFIFFGVFSAIIAFNLSFFDFQSLLLKTLFYLFALALTIKQFDFITAIFRISTMIYLVLTIPLVLPFFISTPEVREFYVLLDIFVSGIIILAIHGSQTKIDKELNFILDNG